jgi:hypothetical protein
MNAVDDREFFDNALKTLNEYTVKVKRLRDEYKLTKKESKKESKSLNKVLPAGIRGSANDTTIIQWKRSLRPFS